MLKQHLYIEIVAMSLVLSQKMRVWGDGKDKLTWDVTTQCQDYVDEEVLSDAKSRCNSYRTDANGQ